MYFVYWKREDAHKKKKFLVVGPLRGEGVKPTEPLRKKTTFFYQLKKKLPKPLSCSRGGGYSDLIGPTTKKKKLFYVSL